MTEEVYEIIRGMTKKYLEFNIDGTLHLLSIADSTKIMKKLPKNSINLILTDPPYNRGLDYGKYYNDKKPWDVYFKEAFSWLKEMSRVLALDGSMYMITYPEISARFLVYLEDKLNMKVRRWITWHYPTNIGHSKKNFTRSQRTILFVTKSSSYTFNKQYILQPYKNPNVSKIKKRIKAGNYGRGAYDFLTFDDLQEMESLWKLYLRGDVIIANLLKNVSKLRFTYDKKSKKGHPCQLPLSLLAILILVSSKPGDLIFDPFAGTFTLNQVAALLKRNSIGIEINPKYIKYGKLRFKGVI